MRVKVQSLMWKSYEKIRRDGILSLIDSVAQILIRQVKTTCYVWWSQRCFEPSSGLPKDIWVDPAKIEYNSTMTRAQFPTTDKSVREFGCPYDQPIVGVLGGPWDKLKIDWFSDIRPKAMKQKFVDGVDWQDTEYYDIKVAASSNSNSEPSDGLERIRDIDRLYKSMKRNGYLTQEELLEQGSRENELQTASPSMDSINGDSWPNECRIGIGRNGELIRIKSAKTRVTIAKLLDINRVPAIVVVRHRRWQEIRDAFSTADSLEELPKSIRQYADHPDLADVQPRDSM